MEDSLGSGFDSIRAAVMSPTAFSSHLTVSPAFIHTATDLEGSSFLAFGDTGLSETSGRTNSFSESASFRLGLRESSSLPRAGEIGVFDRNVSSGHEIRSYSHDMRSLGSVAGTNHFYRSVAGLPEHPQDIVEIEGEEEEEVGTHSSVQYELLDQDQEYTLPQSVLDDDESDPDDTCKFYTELDAYTMIGPADDDDDNDDDYAEYSDDYETDSDYELNHDGQMLTSLNRYDHRYYRYWDAEQAELATNHFDSSLQATQERNFTVEQFIKRWLQASLTNSAHVPSQFPCPSLEAANVIQWPRPEKIVRPPNLDVDEFYDIQQIPWKEKLGVRREDARVLRDAWYCPYYNLHFSNDDHPRTLPRWEHYFRATALYTDFKATIEHFQLRNLMAVTSFNTVQFAHESQLLSWTPDYKQVNCVMDLSHPAPETGLQGSVKISTMQANDELTVAGGFGGEYCMHARGSEAENIYGFVTRDVNGITNNIDIIQSRKDSSPLVVFASNDQHIRTLHCASNKFISDHELPIPVNCSQTSADGRMRIIVGDSPEALVLEAESGRTLHQLHGHRDYGFACAWSPDMLHIATSNQDRTVNIWDVRMWRILQSMHSDRACYRSLRFSPIGGGPRTLLMCEPADRIAVVNATTYESRQVHDFFGEIGGADYTSDGESVWVANTDENFGGFMRFDRMQYGQRYASPGSSSRRYHAGRYEEDEARKFAPGWYSNLPHEWINEAGLDEDAKCAFGQRERDFRSLNGLSDEARDNLLI